MLKADGAALPLEPKLSKIRDSVGPKRVNLRRWLTLLANHGRHGQAEEYIQHSTSRGPARCRWGARGLPKRETWVQKEGEVCHRNTLKVKGLDLQSPLGPGYQGWNLSA